MSTQTVTTTPALTLFAALVSCPCRHAAVPSQCARHFQGDSVVSYMVRAASADEAAAKILADARKSCPRPKVGEVGPRA